jgi:hypothetical protein
MSHRNAPLSVEAAVVSLPAVLIALSLMWPRRREFHMRVRRSG